ncbi:MAG TPA: RNA-directed DNA polymerase [Pseudonocardiaceae bacterium]|jgi:hypothetical protein
MYGLASGQAIKLCACIDPISRSMVNFWVFVGLARMCNVDLGSIDVKDAVGVGRLGRQSRGEMGRYDEFKAIANVIDLDAACVPASRRNDLLPPRVEDNVGGQVGKAFVEPIVRSIDRGEYDPSPAHVIAVPKPNNSTRSAALLTLPDRVLFHALVAPFAQRIETRLVSESSLFWPRASGSQKRWTDFEKAPLLDKNDYVVRTDVSGFYDSIDHDLLRDILIEVTGKSDLALALYEFLNRTMCSTRGIPQGLDSSDILATVFLSKVDSAMLQEGLRYYRHGDDVRISVDDYDDGRRAVFKFEQELRGLRLLLNAEKTRILRHHTYEQQLGSLEVERERIQELLTDLKMDGLLEADLDEVEDLMEKAGIDEDTQFQIFYHQTMTMEEIADELRPHVEVDQLEIARAIFEDVMTKAPNVDTERRLSREVFHGVLSNSLTTLAAGRDAFAAGRTAQLIADFPDETALVCSYLRALKGEVGEVVAKEVETALCGSFVLGWQSAWLLSVLQEVIQKSEAELPETLWSLVVQISLDESSDWIARSAAIFTLGLAGLLEQDAFRRLWARLPAPFRPEVAAALSLQAKKLVESTWEEIFLDTLKSDPVIRAVTQSVNR